MSEDDKVGRMYKHFKNGDIYKYIGEGKLESDPTQRLVIYQCDKSGRIWVRPYEEFFGYIDEDGMTFRRFSPYHKYIYND